MISTFKFISFFCFFSLNAVPVRVLLDEQKNPSWKISSPRGFQIRSSKTGKELPCKVTYHALSIKGEKGVFLINGKKFKEEELCIVPYAGGTHFKKERYDGSLFLAKKNDSFFLINVLESEDYIYSVLKTESWPGWPVEVNKAFAVASRSYLLYQMLHARKQGRLYHIRNTNFHQTYTGMHQSQSIRDAVDATKGIFLGHNGEPILAMFDSCCGGIIPRHIQGIVDFEKAPYLARPYACTFCKTCKIYSWKVDYTLEEFIERLQEGVTDSIIHSLKDVKVTKKDKAGIVQEVVARTSQASLSFKAQDIYQLLSGVKSFCFSLQKKQKTVTIKGRGYGHHIGLCQWGARQMVDKGWTYKGVLRFYYPGTVFMELEDTTIG